jgi:hypothetical protein
MPWSTMAKDISATSVKPHTSSTAGIIGRPPNIQSFNFKPAEFFGAGARCSFTHLINPALVTPESEMVKFLVREHIDDTMQDFAIQSSADDLKDYVKSYFAGTVASALAYLAMIRDGYVWSDHFENVGWTNKSTKRTPDFVFARQGASDVALMESKGTRSAGTATFDKTVEDGYVGQIMPHLGTLVGGATASHGYSIGSYLKSTSKAELNIHHTDAVAATPPSGTPVGSIAAVQQNNYATAFRLAHSERLSQQVRAGDLPDEVPFYQFEWLGRKWLTSGLIRGWYNSGDERYHDTLEQLRYERLYRPFGRDTVFAVDRDRAEAVLRGLSEFRESRPAFDIAPMPEGLMQEARSGEDESALFPDGLAVSYNMFASVKEFSRTAVWRTKDRKFQVFG